MMILIIDSNYGKPFDWEGYKELFNGEKVSPTHAEYRFALHKQKRMIVFIRKELMTYYQSYRKLQADGNSNDDTEKKLTEVLPSHIDYNIFKFIREVKTNKPIPWIIEFENSLEVKKKFNINLIMN